jgi:diaminopimelate epimerase
MKQEAGSLSRPVSFAVLTDISFTFVRMIFHFSKYEGSGNDFIMADNRNGSFEGGQQLIAQLCDRRFGIGADGLILIESSGEADFFMRYYNSDGRESTFCGNGGRCAAAFAKKLEINGNSARFLARDGFHEAEINGEQVRLKMRDTKLPEIYQDGFFLFTGSPHLVFWVNDVDQTDVYSQGRKIRTDYSEEGSNVNFAQRLPDRIRLRTYERGVENETLSCGTGVTAAALIAALGGLSSPVQVETPGGLLKVEFQRKADGFSDVYLSGPARFVFSGTISAG